MKKLKPFFKKQYSRILSGWVKLFLKKDLVNQRIIFIISFHRSGSTWIQEYLTQNLSAATIFEPLFTSENYKLSKHFNINEAIYIDNKDKETFIKNYLQKVISRFYLTRWSISRSSTKSIINSNVLIVKFIRANFIVQLLKDNFRDIEKVYLFRNPFAIIESVIRGGGAWKKADKAFLLKYYQSFLNQKPNIATFIQGNVDDNIRLVLLTRWCIEISECVKGLTSKDNVVFYELLKKKESDAMDKLNEYFGIDGNSSTSSHEPSSSTSNVDFIQKNYPYWIEHYNDAVQEKAQQILNYFSISFYELTSFYPLEEKLILEDS